MNYNHVRLQFFDEVREMFRMPDRWKINDLPGFKGKVARWLINKLIKYGVLENAMLESVSYKEVIIPKADIYNHVTTAIAEAAGRLRERPTTIYIGRLDFQRLFNAPECRDAVSFDVTSDPYSRSTRFWDLTVHVLPHMEGFLIV